MSTTKWRIMIDLSYEDKGICIQEFEKVVLSLKNSGYRSCRAGSGGKQYLVQGPAPRPFSSDEIEKLRKLII